MKLLNFINNNPDWPRKLAAAPYKFKIETHRPYFLINATDASTDPMALEAHGTIFKEDKNTGKIICVNYPFMHVRSFDDPKAPVIDWATVETYLHIDGILICVWNDMGHWHASSDKYFDLNRKYKKSTKTILSILYEACGGNFTNLTTNLSPEYCYSFILTSPDCKNIANYGDEAKLWYITKRNVFTMTENNQMPAFNCPVYTPFHFLYLRRPDVLEALQKIVTEDEVGYICVDNKEVRVRVNGDAWQPVEKKESQLSFSGIVELWQKNELEKYLEDYEEDDNIIVIINCINNLVEHAEKRYEENAKFANGERKLFMLRLPRFLPCTSGYMLERWLGRKENTAEEYFKKAKLNDIMRDLQYEITSRRSKK